MSMCGMCRHARKFDVVAAWWGECRRFPPTLNAHGTPMWPPIQRTDSCGEFTPKRKVKPSEEAIDLLELTEWNERQTREMARRAKAKVTP